MWSNTRSREFQVVIIHINLLNYYCILAKYISESRDAGPFFIRKYTLTACVIRLGYIQLKGFFSCHNSLSEDRESINL
jgi:hypothetical protein